MLKALTPEGRSVLSHWAGDLMFGSFEQCNGQLKRDNAYCCLGVLSTRLAPTPNFSFNNDLGIWEALTEEGIREIEGQTYNESTIPRSVLAANGIELEQNFFWKLNDTKGMSFAQIGKVVETILETQEG